MQQRYRGYNQDNTRQTFTNGVRLCVLRFLYLFLGEGFLTRKGKAWVACNSMNKILSSDLDRNFKLKNFKAAVEPILLYGSETRKEIGWDLYQTSNESAKYFMEKSSHKGLISDLLLWKPFSQNKRERKLTYSDVISRYVGLKQVDLRTEMMDREVWRGYVESIVSTAIEK